MGGGGGRGSSGGRGSGKHLHSNIPGGGYGAFNHDGSAASGNDTILVSASAILT